MTVLTRMIAMGALAGSLMAQPPGGRFGPRASATPPDPATVAQNEVARLTTILTLTTNQAAQATTIFTNALTAASSLETTMNSDRQSLEAAITSNATATIDQVSQNIGVLSGQITSIQSKANAAFYAILTAAQQTQFTQLGGLAGRGGPGGFGGPGGRGPGGPPPGRP
ncbi:MAG TPA: Spy/CpxP family protein refolding chaperone [Bryobacteraceae bacterium]